MGKTRSWKHVLGAVLFYGGLINFMAFWIVGVSLGGDALRGRVEGGRYLLKGKITDPEVSRSVYIATRTQAISAVAGFPLTVVGWFLLPPGRPKEEPRTA